MNRRSRLPTSSHPPSKTRLLPVELPDSMFDVNQLALGIDEEMKHADDIDVARKVAKSRLMENPKYYKHLSKLEKQMKSNWVTRNIKQKLSPTFPWSLKIY